MRKGSAAVQYPDCGLQLSVHRSFIPDGESLPLPPDGETPPLPVEVVEFFQKTQSASESMTKRRPSYTLDDNDSASTPEDDRLAVQLEFPDKPRKDANDACQSQLTASRPSVQSLGSSNKSQNGILYWIASMLLCGRTSRQESTVFYLRRISQCALLCMTALVIGFVTYVVLVGNRIGDEFTKGPASAWLGSPVLLTDFSRDYCVFLKNKASSLVHIVETYNKQHGFLEVSFTSDQSEKVAAWYLPSPVDATAPRVVLLHGLEDSPVSSSVQTAAYMLRLMGFSALILDLTIPKSDSVSKITTFFDSFRSISAAWEYAVNDPDGVLGGPVKSSSVGLMGFAIGGYSAQAAFASDVRIPAVLVDGVIHDLKALLRSDVRRDGSGTRLSAVDALLLSQAESRCSVKLQVHFDKMESIDELFVERDGTAKVGLIQSAQDQRIPDEQRQKFKEFFQHALGEDSLLLDWRADVENKFDEQCDAGQVHLVLPLDYFEQLCSFWANVFDGSTGRCPTAVGKLNASLAR